MFRILCALAFFSLLVAVIMSDVKGKGANPDAGISHEQILKSPGDNWLTYAGDYGAKRFSPLKQVNSNNVRSLSPRWIYQIENSFHLRVTPLVHNGVMFVTNAYEIAAINAATGKRIWYWRSEDYKEGGLNRGAALLGDKVFMVTGDCKLVALDRLTGKLAWKKKYANTEDGYFATLAPLALKDRIIVGVSSGTCACGRSGRGFIAALSASNGKELWRFWTVPRKGESQAETWGENIDHVGGGATWVNGTYDHELNLLYWPTGNPRPAYEGDFRPGDNLYSNSVLAIDPDTGKLKWHFQFYPHDTHDWDAAEYPVLVDMIWNNRFRQLLIQANRNGFFYVLDRTNGEFLLGKPFVRRLTWASGLDNNGRPILVPDMEGYDLKKNNLCPWVRGATNWMSPSYNPDTKLFYVVALEQCGREKGDFFLKAIDPQTGDLKWEYPMPGPSNMTAGTVTTEGGLVFAGDDSGHLVALDAKTGECLWQFSLGRPIFASPMTYAVGFEQYIAIAAGSDIFSFALFKN